MNRYPFITASLPDIQVGTRPDVSFKDMQDLLALNLPDGDFEKVGQLLELIDIDNIKAFWLGLPLHSAGSMDAKELEEAILVKDFLPSFVIEFLERYETAELRLEHFPALYAGLYEKMASASDRFVRSYYALEREIRLVLTALRAKQLGRDLVLELQFEDVYDPFVMQILVQKDTEDYTPPQEYEALKDLFMENYQDPMKLYRSLLQYRFDKILELEEEFGSFAIDRILGFLSRLMIVEMWSQLDEQKGLDLVDDLSKNG